MIDIIFIVILGYGILRGLFKGFIVEAITLFGLLVGLWIAGRYSASAATYLSNFLDISSRFSILVAFLLIAILTVLIFSLSAHLLKNIVKLVLLGWLDKLLGMLFGFCKYLFVLSLFANILCWIEPRFPVLKEETRQTSKLFEPVRKVVPALMPYVSFEKIKQKAVEMNGQIIS
jgi:membrane protein required for colicin V production